MNGAELLVAALENEGVQRIFGVPGEENLDVVEALRSDRTTSKTPIMVLTAKDLTEADKRQLNGRVSNILQRGTTGASDLVSMLRLAIGNEGAEA